MAKDSRQRFDYQIVDRVMETTLVGYAVRQLYVGRLMLVKVSVSIGLFIGGRIRKRSSCTLKSIIDVRCSEGTCYSQKMRNF
jgi:hypothetical protein